MHHPNVGIGSDQNHNFRLALVTFLLTLFTFFMSINVSADDMVTTVIPLHYRSAADLRPLLQDFVDKDGTIKATEGKLILRTHPANLKELRDVIAKLDTPLRRLIITVKQLKGESARQTRAALEAQRTEKNGVAHSISIWQTDARDNANRVQSIQVTEGHEAFIDVGRQIPISDFAVSHSRTGTLIEQKTRYVGATTGFYVHPHLNGETVTVDITPYQTTQLGHSSPPKFNTQTLHTSVSGKLGEWLTIGASSTNTDQTNQNVIEYSTSQHGEQDRLMLLRVTIAP